MTYTFQVRAVNAAGNSPVPDEVRATPKAPAPTSAQPHTVWSATLTADAADEYVGCSNPRTGQDNCSATSVLTDDGFTYKGTVYTIKTLNRHFAGSLILDFDDLTGAKARTALGALTLTVGDRHFAVSNAVVSSRGYLVFSSLPAWTNNQKISVKLTGPTPPDADGDRRLVRHPEGG